jgi:hypothetical protein
MIGDVLPKEHPHHLELIIFKVNTLADKYERNQKRRHQTRSV